MYSEGCGSGYALWQAALALNRTATFIQKVASRKLTATRLGLVWPPSSSTPGTPKTRYIYDVTRPGAEKWFPKSLLSPMSGDVHFDEIPWPSTPVSPGVMDLSPWLPWLVLLLIFASGLAQMTYADAAQARLDALKSLRQPLVDV